MDCPAGFSCNRIDKSPCDPGQYSLNGTETCKDCPRGYACKTTYSLPEVCPDGFFAEGKKVECTECPAGEYCPDKRYSGIPCGFGTYAYPRTSSNCTSCPAGYQCKKDGPGAQCISGTYSELGDEDCHTCGKGYYCPDRKFAIKLPCPPGSYSNGTSASCTECNPGHKCPDSTLHDGGAEPCLIHLGEYAGPGQAVCSQCPAGYSCEINGQITPCRYGYYSGIGASNCSVCPAGKKCPNPADEPITCESGYYSDQGSTTCTVCKPGYYCKSGSTGDTMAKCGNGTYSTGGKAACSTCQDGYLCPAGSTTSTPLNGECAVGGYCIGGVRELCPPRTYGIVRGGISREHACITCEDGYYCDGTGLTSGDRELCRIGHYCKGGQEYKCESTTFTDQRGLQSQSQCTDCPAGHTCINGKKTTCTAAHYCPAKVASGTLCPDGTYSDKTGLIHSSQCTPCPVGHKCTNGQRDTCDEGTYNDEEGQSTCKSCPARFYCPSAGMNFPLNCPVGKYCNSSVSIGTDCPTGRYGNATNLYRAEECIPCEAGYYCKGGTLLESRELCNQGYYCPSGTQSTNENPCPAGRYSSQYGLTDVSECSICPPGSYCNGSSPHTTAPCKPGYYCPAGTNSSSLYRCPKGTYSNAYSLGSLIQCTVCSPGHYCPEPGRTEELECPSGTYQPYANATSSSECLECPGGYKCPVASIQKIECGKGYFSVPRNESCHLCREGHYCGSATTSLSMMTTGGGDWNNAGDLSGVCFDGTVCPVGMDRAPNLINDACPAGHYCTLGRKQECPGGTYNPFIGGMNLTSCLLTPPGHYSISSSENVTGLCNPGHYCPLKSDSPDKVQCRKGTFRKDYGAGSEDECSTCLAGGFCKAGSIIPETCPEGSFCISGVSNAETCPLGTYSNSTSLENVDACTPCDAGKFCNSRGLTEPVDFCSAGWYCPVGSNSSQPYGRKCPVGYYCGIGSPDPLPCPAGTYSNILGISSVGECTNCTEGSYCEGVGNSEPDGLCSAGWYCPPGSSSPTQFEASAGHFALSGSSSQSACETGTYQPHKRSSSCIQCPVGYYCNETGLSSYETRICPRGHYCPLGTSQPIECPTGRYGATQGMIEENDCTLCTPGKYCTDTALTEPQGNCAAGYYCPSGTTTATPQTSKCPIGHYCLEGSSTYTECPVGTWSNETGNDGNKQVNGRNYFCDLLYIHSHLYTYLLVLLVQCYYSIYHNHKQYIRPLWIRVNDYYTYHEDMALSLYLYLQDNNNLFHMYNFLVV